MNIGAIPTRYDGQEYRSRIEARWAVFFDCCGIAFQYEANGYQLETCRYLPDFWLSGWQMFFEVKGVEPNADEESKCEQLARITRRPVLLGIDGPKPRFQIQWYDENGCDGRLYTIARDRSHVGGHWLMAQDLERPIGDGEGKLYGPMMGGALGESYDISTWYRFDKIGHRRAPRMKDEGNEYRNEEGLSEVSAEYARLAQFERKPQSPPMDLDVGLTDSDDLGDVM